MESLFYLVYNIQSINSISVTDFPDLWQDMIDIGLLLKEIYIPISSFQALQLPL
jgi:hypothetical protein